MVTIIDVAKAAGVSCGTVSNVLNKKGNVKADKIRLIEDAIKRLGYSVNESARTLRKLGKRSISLVVPDMRGKHYIDLYESISSCMRAYDYSVEIYSTNNLFYHEKNIIQKLVSSNVSCIVAFPTFINAAEVYDSIPNSIALIIVGPRPKNILRPYINASFDYGQMATDIVEYIIDRGYKKSAVFIDNVRFSSKFTNVLQQKLTRSCISVSILGSSNRTSIIRAFEFISANADYDVIVTSNTTRAQAIKQVYELLHPKKEPEIITLTSSISIFEGNFTAVYQDYKKLGTMLSDVLIGAFSSDSVANDCLVLKSEGINRRPLLFGNFSGTKALEVLVPENRCTLAMSHLLPKFESSSKIKVNMSFYPAANLNEVLVSGRVAQYDLFISDMNYFENYTKGLYLDASADRAQFNELQSLIDPSSTYFPHVGENRFCYSFNAECLMLFYRNDILSEQREKRLYYESFYNELSYPKTLEEFDRISSYFNRSSNPSSPILYGLAMSSINSESFWSEFFWRILACNTELLDEKGRLHFNAPTVVAAVEKFFSNLSKSNASSLNQTSSAVDEFARGNSVLSIMTTGDAAVFNDNKFGAIAEHVKCFDTPESIPVVKSDIIGIVDGSDMISEACAFLRWAFHSSISGIITLMSGQPITRSSTSNNEILSLYPWLKYFDVSIAHGKLLSELFTDCIISSAFRREFVYSFTNAYNRGADYSDVLSKLQALYEKGAFS
ncbi:MAG: LacI family DNA-binding transcriptional regulator [Christensenellaceae bacterium]